MIRRNEKVMASGECASIPLPATFSCRSSQCDNSDPPCQSALAGSDETQTTAADFSLEELASVAKKVCFGIKGYPELTTLDGEPTEAYNDLVYNLRTVLYDLFSTSQSSVRWVNDSHQAARPGGGPRVRSRAPPQARHPPDRGAQHWRARAARCSRLQG